MSGKPGNRHSEFRTGKGIATGTGTGTGKRIEVGFKGRKKKDDMNDLSIHRISEKQFSRVLIGSCNSEDHWVFTVLRPEPRWRLVSRHFRKTKFEQYIMQSTKKFQEGDEFLLVIV